MVDVLCTVGLRVYVREGGKRGDLSLFACLTHYLFTLQYDHEVNSFKFGGSGEVRAIC